MTISLKKASQTGYCLVKLQTVNCTGVS